jgi:hypothetical protein
MPRSKSRIKIQNPPLKNIKDEKKTPGINKSGREKKRFERPNVRRLVLSSSP